MHWFLLAACTFGLGSSAYAAVSPSARCEHAKLNAAGKAVRGVANCYARAASRATEVDSACVAKFTAKLSVQFSKAELKGGCLFLGDATDVVGMMQTLATNIDALLGSSEPSKCTSRKWKASGKRASDWLRHQGKHSRIPEREKLAAAVQRSEQAFTRSFTKADGGSGCPQTGDAQAVAASVDTGTRAVVDQVRGSLARLAEQRGIQIGAAARGGVLQAAPERYAETLREQFNYITPEFELMWGNLEPVRGSPNFGPADTVIEFAEQNGMKVKAIPLVWHMILPNWVPPLDAAELQTALDDRIASLVGRYRGRVSTWVVVNEAVDNLGFGLRNSIFLQKLGSNYIADAFRAARAADPDARLFYNDFFIEDIGTKSDFVLAMVEDLLAQGVPIDGVGFQMHLSGGLLGIPTRFQENIERFAALGLQVDISEMDVQLALFPGKRADQLNRQREVYRDRVRECLAVPACHAITFWGFTDAYTWIRDFLGRQDDPLLYDEFILPKAAFFGVRDALVEN